MRVDEMAGNVCQGLMQLPPRLMALTVQRMPSE